MTGGDVQLGAGMQHLTLLPTITPAVGTEFWIIDNTGSGATTGNFDGLPEGSLVSVGGDYFNIYYNADHATDSLTGGNDVLLVATTPEPGSAVCLLAGVGMAALQRRRRRAKPG